MRHAEDGVDELGVDFAGRQLQQRRLHRVERLEALFEEDFVELREIERHAGYSSSGLTPSRSIAFSSVAERPIHLYATPFSRQSSANATMSCTPAVSTVLDTRAVDLVGSGLRGLREQMGTNCGRFLDGAGGAEDDTHRRVAAVAGAGLAILATAITGTGSRSRELGAERRRQAPPTARPPARCDFHGICQTRFTRIQRLHYVVGRSALVVEGCSSHASSDFHGFSVRPAGSPHSCSRRSSLASARVGAAARDDFLDAGAAARHADGGLVAARVHAGGAPGPARRAGRLRLRLLQSCVPSDSIDAAERGHLARQSADLAERGFQSRARAARCSAQSGAAR